MFQQIIFFKKYPDSVSGLNIPCQAGLPACGLHADRRLRGLATQARVILGLFLIDAVFLNV